MTAQTVGAAPAVQREPAPGALVASGVTRAFAGVQALGGVGLAVEKGRVLGLIGPNGAGKSTLVNILSGYDRPDEGTVWMDGEDVTALVARKRARSGLARTFQHGQTYAGLTVRENIEIASLGSGKGRRAARAEARGLLERLGLDSRAEQTARTLLHGTERRLGVARALAMYPRYLLLDEPAAGLNEGEIGEFAELIREIAADGVGVLLIDHNMGLVMGVSDLVHVVVQGESYLEGTPAQVRGSAELNEAYLGRSGQVRD